MTAPYFGCTCIPAYVEKEEKSEWKQISSSWPNPLIHLLQDLKNETWFPKNFPYVSERYRYFWDHSYKNRSLIFPPTLVVVNGAYWTALLAPYREKKLLSQSEKYFINLLQSNPFQTKVYFVLSNFKLLSLSSNEIETLYSTQGPFVYLKSNYHFFDLDQTDKIPLFQKCLALLQSHVIIKKLFALIESIPSPSLFHENRTPSFSIKEPLFLYAGLNCYRLPHIYPLTKWNGPLTTFNASTMICIFPPPILF